MCTNNKILFVKVILMIFASGIIFRQSGHGQPLNQRLSEIENGGLTSEAGLLINPCSQTNVDNPIFIEEINPYFSINHYQLKGGKPIHAMIIKGPPKPPEHENETRAAGISLIKIAKALPDFPSFNWVFGSSAVSGAMIAAYYDRFGYSSIYTGPTNDGIYPTTDTGFGNWVDSISDTYPENPLVASHFGVDGRQAPGSIENYWVSIESHSPDPFVANGWVEHGWGEAIGDYMKTSQSQFGNRDGWTRFYYNAFSTEKLTCADLEESGYFYHDGNYGRKLFYESRGYLVKDCYTQATDNKVVGGFSFEDFKAEIDGGHPVMIHIAGHTMVGFGYENDFVLVRDAWDSNPKNIYAMPWGGHYYGMELWAVSIVHPGSKNLPPEGIYLSENFVFDQMPIGWVVGKFSTEDPNLGGRYTYSLVPGDGGADNDSFSIDRDRLRTKQIFQSEIKNTYNIRVRSTDQGGLWVEKRFEISVIPGTGRGIIFIPIVFGGNWN